VNVAPLTLVSSLIAYRILFRRKPKKPVKPPANSSKLDGSGTPGVPDWLIVRCAGPKVKVPKLVNGTPKPDMSVPPQGERRVRKNALMVCGFDRVTESIVVQPLTP
jgi:hypothetical protein